MADQRIQYTEEMVGYGHPTKADTLNRLALVDHGTDGQHTLSGFQGSQFAADAGANDTYVITLDPVPAAYFTGMMIVFTANTANTGAATINVNSLGAKAIKKQKDVALGDGDIKAGQTVVLVYDGTNFQLVNPPSGSNGNVFFSGSVTLAGQDGVTVTHGKGDTSYLVKTLPTGIGGLGRIGDISYVKAANTVVIYNSGHGGFTADIELSNVA